MRKLLFFVAVLATFGYGCTSQEPEGPGLKEIKLTADESAIVEGQQKLAFELFDKMNGQASTSDNTLLSPLSAHTALSMLANGTEEQSLNDICDFLNISPSQLDGLNTLNNQLMRDLPRLDKDVELKIANSLWSSQYAQFLDSYSSLISNTYKAETFNVDFMAGEGKKAINDWIAKATDNMLDKIEIPDATSMAIANCIKFDGKWKYPFDKKKTSDRNFYNAESQAQYVPTMEGGGTGAKAEGFTAVRLWYGNQAFSMTLLLPDDSATPLSSTEFSYEKWSKIKQALKSNHFSADIYLPRFSMKMSTDLLDVFNSIKPTEVFSKSANFSRLTDAPVKVSHIFHNTAIEVNEESTKATASTVIDFEPISPGDISILVDFNRPFFYVIDEASTGAILFIGALNKI